MKSFFIVLLAIATTQACVPGSLFYNKCNLCKCLADGKTHACVDKVCPENFLGIETNRKFCTPGNLFKRACNLCKCSTNGQYATCTQMYCSEIESFADADDKFCEPLKVFKLDEFNTCICNRDGTSAMCTLNLPSANDVSTASFVKNGQYCTPGTTFKLDECNTCKCSYDGTKALCSLSACPGNKLESNQVCRPKSIFNDYCNTCFCSEDGSGFSCTKMLCDESVWYKNGTMKVFAKQSVDKEVGEKQICQPLKKFKNYCNTCLCSADGTKAACTNMYCDEKIWFKNGTRRFPEQVCTPNSRFMEYCNLCTCSEDGSVKACTFKDCGGLYNKDGSLKISLKHFIGKKVCEPKSTFSLDGCNTCICNEQGTQYGCTLKSCDDYEVVETKDEKWDSLYKQGDACTPGKLFNSECNTCICLKDGQSAACTLKMC